MNYFCFVDVCDFGLKCIVFGLSKFSRKKKIDKTRQFCKTSKLASKTIKLVFKKKILIENSHTQTRHSVRFQIKLDQFINNGNSNIFSDLVAAAAAAASSTYSGDRSPRKIPYGRVPIFKSDDTSTAPIMGGAYTCERCGNSYARPHSLNRHKRFECGVEPKFECPICRKKSKHKHNLVLHMRTHQPR